MLVTAILLCSFGAVAVEMPIRIEETRVMGEPTINSFEIGSEIIVNGIEEPQEHVGAPVGYFWMPYGIRVADLSPKSGYKAPMLIYAGTFRPQACGYFKISNAGGDCDALMNTTQTLFVYGVPQNIRSMDRQNGSKIRGTRLNDGTWELELINWPAD